MKVISKNVCIVFRGELLRNNLSCFWGNNSKNLRKYDVSEKSFNRQNNIMESIIKHIITPYKEKGYNVFVSGCVYECPEYYKNLTDYFPNNTIKKIKPGKTNQGEVFYLGIEHAEKEHPECLEYISLRTDYIMLRNININKLSGMYACFGWENKYIAEVDVFWIISKNTINILKKILIDLGFQNNRVHTHYLAKNLKENNVSLHTVWNDYENKCVALCYKEYINDLEIHKNRPFVNYMRNRND